MLADPTLGIGRTAELKIANEKIFINILRIKEFSKNVMRTEIIPMKIQGLHFSSYMSQKHLLIDACSRHVLHWR